MTLMETDSLRNGHTDNFHIAFTNLNLNTHNDGKIAQNISHSKQIKQYPFLSPEAKISKELKDDTVCNVKSAKHKYGELILLGYNGSLHEGDKGRKRSKFEMVARPEGSANGVSFRARRKYTPEADDSANTFGGGGHVGTVREALDDVRTYAVAYTFNDVNNNKDNGGSKVNKVNNNEGEAVVVVLHEYGLDPELDMYQVGRSPEKPIDFVVLDTLRPSPTGQHSAPPLSHNAGQHNGSNNNNGSNQHHSSHRHHQHHHHPHSSHVRHGAPPLTTTPQGGASKERTNGAREQSAAPNSSVKSSSAAAILTESTISRFACRFTVQRSSPHTVRVYAAGFDTSNNIFLGPKAVKWRQGDDLFDGLTTNGVLIAHPDPSPLSADDATADSLLSPHRIPYPPSKWYEVSVEGRLYTLRLPQSMNTCGSLVEGEDNALQDWTLIDICGATLLYRSAQSLECSPNAKTVESYVEQVNSLKPQCPVRLSTLVVPKRLANNAPTTGAGSGPDNRPYVYLKCGHVQGLHQWGKEGSHNRKCPICQKIGPFAPLYPGLESAFYVEDGPLTHSFDPCGHMTNQSTARYWSSITIPSAEFKRICPFCATELAEPGYVKLHFQSEN